MKLIFQNGERAGTEQAVDRKLTIGRHPSCDLVLQDPAVSQVHCTITVENGRAFVTDQGSTNGVHVNGVRVITAPLRNGDTIAIGYNTIRVSIPPDQSLRSAETQPLEDAASEPTAARDGEIRELSHSIFGSVTYFLKRKIADGGMGSVYEALQFGAEGFTKRVAIKTILPSYAKKEGFVSSFVGEAKLVANLVHQNIVQTHHLGRHENGYYIAMEYIDGISLTEFMALHDAQKRHVSPKIATFIVSRVARGLEYAHNKCDEQGTPLGLVHRDVSPNNLMINREGEVKLTDFGVAKAAQFMKSEEEGMIIGSPEYMSPEQAAGQKVDGRSDIFSLGLVFYELLTGLRIFESETGEMEPALRKVRAAVIPDPRESRPDLPGPIVAILRRMLEKDPADRFQTAGDLAQALESELYSKGYGPTVVTLAKYVERLLHGRPET